MAKAEHLSKEEELRLGYIIQQGYRAKEELAAGKRLRKAQKEELESLVKEGEAAVDKLVSANLGLVYDRAWKFKAKYPASATIEDLVSMGSLGLMTAVHKYDPERKNKFSTVAVHWIQQAIGREVNKTARLVRLPENRIVDYIAMNKTIAALGDDAEDMSTAELDELLMKENDLTEEALFNIRRAAATPASLNKKVGKSSDDATKELIDIIGHARAADSTEAVAMSNSLALVLHEAISTLSEDKQKIVNTHFSLGSEDSTAKAVREELDLTYVSFRKKLSEALYELKEKIENQGLDFYDFMPR